MTVQTVVGFDALSLAVPLLRRNPNSCSQVDAPSTMSHSQTQRVQVGTAGSNQRTVDVVDKYP